MKKFKFRLEKVLQHRDVIKEEKLRELKSATQKLREAEDKLDFLEQEFEGNKAIEDSALRIEEVLIRSNYSVRLKSEIESQKIAILKAQELVEDARKIYIEASQESEVLVKLKERKKEVYNHEMQHEEEKFLDELTTQRVRFTSTPE